MLLNLYNHQNKFLSVGRIFASRYAPASFSKSHNPSRNIIAPLTSFINREESEGKYRNNSSNLKSALALALSGSALVGIYSYLIHNGNVAECSEKEKNIYSREEVSKKKTMETGIWVIYGRNVYDITDFVNNHPGGYSKVILAAGSNLEPYWSLYAIHKKQEVLDLLQEYYIGELREEDWVVEEEKKGPYANDPKRHPVLVINSNEPFNAETPPALAVYSLLTPNDMFYVRNHLPVPDLKADETKLTIDGLGLSEPIVISVDELKTKFKKSKIIAAIQCAGNRRNEMNKIKQVKGLTWSSNAISNAEWGGVYLHDVLVYAGVNPDNVDIKHIHFEGADKGPTGAPYGASIPSNRIFKKDLPVMIAYEMNGEPIPRDHGYPLRLVAPGIVGARSVKWLQHITVSKEEYGGHWQQNDYKPFSPNIDWHNVDFSKSPAIQELPVTSAICSPPAGATFDEEEEEITVKGYAYSGGGKGIIRVDVSADGGVTWHTAELTQADQDLDAMFSWTLWECQIPIPEDHNGKMEILCRAVDSSCNTQPEGIGPVWNLRGVLNNSWFRIDLNIKGESQ